MAKKEEKKEKKKTEKRKEQGKERVVIAKKWKGKDWYAIFAPKMFGEVQIAESPSTDPKNMIGRTIEISAIELASQQQPKPYHKLYFKIISLDDKNARTVFEGFEIAKEYMFRIVRKRSNDFTANLDIAEKKAEEKWNVLSIDECKEELEPHYRIIKEFLNKARI